MRQSVIVALFLVFLYSCGSDSANYGNPHAATFNIADSDEEAIQRADDVMAAIGGRQAWDTTRYISWNFFGRRSHVWDKLENKVRIDIPSDTLSVIVNLDTKGGSAKKSGQLVTDLEALTDILDSGYKAWVNDSYWLTMPFKLKDDGVTLKSKGEGATTLGNAADMIELSFSGVGVTPQNKYIIYVDKESDLITQWDFFPTIGDTTARFQSPWPNYKKYGDLLLSGGQIAGNKLSNIEVSQTVSEDTWKL